MLNNIYYILHLLWHQNHDATTSTPSNVYTLKSRMSENLMSGSVRGLIAASERKDMHSTRQDA